MDKHGKVLIVDDNMDVLLSLHMLLKNHVEKVQVLTDPQRIPEFLSSLDPDVIILDMNFKRDAISGEEGYEWLQKIQEIKPSAVVLFITAYVDTEKAVRAIKAGAIDFIPKPWNNNKVLATVLSAIELSDSRKIASNKGAVSTLSAHREPIGSSQIFNRLKEQCHTVATTDTSVLILGENGSGKDVIAHYIHENSNRADKPFVSIDLGSLSESLMEDELFGHEKGAYTGANAQKIGRVEMANGGTLFMDEIGNLSAPMQQKLLTLVEKRQITRLGGTKPIMVDFRLICATNAPIHKEVEEGTFRRDLLYRINTIELHTPPLRDREGDVIELAEEFISLFAKKYNKSHLTLSDDAREALLAHSWPGNVRELLHTIERAVVMAKGSVICSADIPMERVEEGNTSTANEEMPLRLEELERVAIRKAIERSDGNLTQAAEILGITRYALYRKLEKIKL
ncbi:MAG: sigma-54 dependent transcriptional regulator [Bacteroidia bacterium]|nr:sigma-54 dependent transcriptional regulator [Bacteroidia bacterium]